MRFEADLQPADLTAVEHLDAYVGGAALHPLDGASQLADRIGDLGSRQHRQRKGPARSP